jgi:hypothetical protein
MNDLFAYGVDQASVDAAITCLEAAVASGRLSHRDVRYILDKTRKVILPKLEREEVE